jgi:hypothetical protein
MRLMLPTGAGKETGVLHRYTPPMNRPSWPTLFSVVSVILILFGVTYTIFGLGFLPVDRAVLLSWESALYGAIMIGWGVTLLLVGRIAFRRSDRQLKTAMLVGIAMWLAVEAIASAVLGVWFNVGVDIGVLLVFSIPLVRSMRS